MIALLLPLALLAPPPADPFAVDAFRPAVDRIQEAALADETTWLRMQQLCDDIGHRLSGSKNLERAIEWAKATLEADGIRVRLQPVKVPHWVRGEESLRLVAPREEALPMLGLGWSSGTPKGGLTAEVVVATDEASFEALGDRVRGRIVLFDNPMPDYHPAHGPGYGETVRFRVKGAAMVAEKGGVGVLVRSVTAHSLRTPHTGTQSSRDGLSKIPAAAITTEDADRIHRMVKRGQTVKVHLQMGARLLGEATSHNVIAEIPGRELPDEIVVVGGHIDSWDVGQGAHDDAGGVVMAMQTLRTLKRLNLTPRRTVRAVLFTNEENGLKGALAYAEAEAKTRHVAAIEADIGAFAPTGYTVEHADPQRAGLALVRLHGLKPLFAPFDATRMEAGFSGADVRPLQPAGALLLGHRTDMARYFDIHHTAADTLDKVDPLHMRQNVAVMATMAWVLAEAPGRLDQPAP